MEEINKEEQIKEEVKQEVNQALEFINRHWKTVTKEGEPDKRMFGVDTALMELFVRSQNIAEAISRLNEAMHYIADEFDKLNTKKIITPDDPNFIKPLNLK